MSHRRCLTFISREKYKREKNLEQTGFLKEREREGERKCMHTNARKINRESMCFFRERE